MEERELQKKYLGNQSYLMWNVSDINFSFNQTLCTKTYLLVEIDWGELE